jgi:two-component system chemotaxis response regulator CheY
MKILITDDNYASRRLMEAFLRKYGDCDLASNGQEAVQRVKEAHENGFKYDLICMDIMMPVMDGVEALRVIRSLEEEWGVAESDAIRIIMTTAKDDRRDIIESFNEGCEGYLIKPVEEEQINKVLQQLSLIS